MFKLDDKFLTELGLGTLPAQDKNKMLAHIYETLEMRVGMKLAEKMSNEQLDEFEAFINSNNESGALKWLETNFPNYKQVVAEELEKLKEEIKKSAPQILEQVAAVPVPPTASGQPVAPQSQQPAQPVQPPSQPTQPMQPPTQPAQPTQPMQQNMQQPVPPTNIPTDQQTVSQQPTQPIQPNSTVQPQVASAVDPTVQQPASPSLATKLFQNNPQMSATAHQPILNPVPPTTPADQQPTQAANNPQPQKKQPPQPPIEPYTPPQR